MRTPVYALLALAGLTAAAQAGQVSSVLGEVLETQAEAKVIVYFQDQLAAPVGRETKAGFLRRLRANLAATQRMLQAEMGFAAAEGRVRQQNWLSNSVSMTLTKDQVAAVADHPAVRRVIYDAPVFAPEVIEDETAKPESGEWTYGLQKLRIPEVREVFGFTGRGVRIGNIDTGADGNHPDIQGRIALYKDPSGTSTEPKDTNGHGTHTVATMVGGDASGTQIGVAPDAELLVARGIAGSSVLSNLLASMEWMTDPDDDPSTDDAPVVVSMSWHTGSGDQSAFYEALANFEAAGIIPNFSAGNSGNSGLTHPKEYPGTVTTAATDSSDNIASFSSRGPAFYNGQEQKKPEWGAPGVDVYSAKPGGGYTKMSGTSMAAPHGAGVIALLFEADPTLTPAQVREVLTSTATDLGPAGWDGAFGHGRLDAFEALSLVATGGKVNGKITDADGNAIPGARLTIVERDFSLAASEDGSFALRLPEGSYTLVASAFAYQSATTSIELGVDEEITVDLTLAPAATVEAAGSVTAAATGDAIEGAKVTVLGTPLASVATGADGAFGFSLPAGTYTFQVTAFGFEVATTEATVPGDALDFALAPLPPVLLVDDDAGKSYESYYQAALDSMGVEYGVLSSSEGMDESTLLPYETVVWFIGDDYSNTLSGDDKTRLGEYLANGGKLIISSQELGYHLKNDAFYTGTLKAKFEKDSSGSKAVSGQGLSFSIEGGDGANNQRYPDAISAQDGATQIFEYANGMGAGVAVDGIAYISFGLEGVSTAENRAALLGKLFELVEGGDAEGVDTASEAARNQARAATFAEMFE